MAKLKFDRLINVIVTNNEKLTVPKGELWKGRVYGIGGETSASINNYFFIDKSLPELTCVEDATIEAGTYKSSGVVKITIQGIAFKVVE